MAKVQSQKRWVALRSYFGSRLSTLDSRLFPRGMTLIELLVVIVILTILVAAAIPLLAPTTSERQLREASRGLNTFLSGAQARAVGQGRPFGVALRRLSKDTGNDAPGNPLNDNSVSIQAFYVEQPPPFAGFDPTSAVQLAIDNGPVGVPGQVLVRFVRQGIDFAQSTDSLPQGWDPDLFPPGLIRPGDVVEAGGTRFVFIANGAAFIDPNTGYYLSDAGTPDGTLATRPTNNTGQIDAIHVIVDNNGYSIAEPPPAGGFVPPYWTSPIAYQILRQPAPTSDEPYQLPADTVIDLRASGIGSQPVDSSDLSSVRFFHLPNPTDPNDAIDNNDEVVVMFTPEGSVERIRYNLKVGDDSVPDEIVDEPIVENVYLLIGPNVPAPPAVASDPTLAAAGWAAALTDADKQRLRGPINWLRGESRWVVIGAASGRIVTVEQNLVDPAVVYAKYVTGLPMLPPSSEALRTQQILAAREGSRGMNQLGGR